MAFLRQYVISIISAALICGLLSGMLKDAGMDKIMRLICGLFLAGTVLYPLPGLEFPSINSYVEGYARESGEASAAGEKLARDALKDIIKQETEAYILDKAAALGADIRVDIRIRDEETPVPKAALIDGEVTAQQQMALQEIMEADLGIPKENQLWTGQK